MPLGRIRCGKGIRDLIRQCRFRSPASISQSVTPLQRLDVHVARPGGPPTTCAWLNQDATDWIQLENPSQLERMPEDANSRIVIWASLLRD